MMIVILNGVNGDTSRRTRTARWRLMTSGPNDPKRKRAFFMANALTQFTITEVIPGYWQVTFSNPPINLEDPDTILEFQELVGEIEADDALKVVVLDSAHPDFFVNHYDVSRAAQTPVEPGPTGLPTFIDTTTRLANSPVVTIASIRGAPAAGAPSWPRPATCGSPAWSGPSSASRKWGRDCSLAAAGSNGSRCWSDGPERSRSFWAATTSTQRPRRPTAGSTVRCRTRNLTTSSTGWRGGSRRSTSPR